MDADGNELECRVCRGGPEDDRKLFFPCMCSGSIGAVHQDCLEAWLNHSKKDTCELCATKYQFEPHYADEMPTVIPLRVFAKTILKSSIFRLFPALLRLAFAFIIWVFVVPILTSTIYCMCVGRPISLSFTDWLVVKGQIVHGVAIDAVIALSLLILISFTDFLRFHLVPVPPDNAPGGAANPVEGVAVEDNGGAGAVDGVENNAVEIAAPAQAPQLPPAHAQQAPLPVALQQPAPPAEAAEATQSPQSPTRVYSRRDNPLYRDYSNSSAATPTATRDNSDGKVLAWENPAADSDDETEDEEEKLPGSPTRPFTRSQLRQREENSPQHAQHQYESGDDERRHGAAYRRKAYEDFDVPDLEEFNFNFNIPDDAVPNHHHNHFNNNNHEHNENHENQDDVARRHAHNNLRLPLADPVPPIHQNNDNVANNNIQDFENINNGDFNDPNDPNFDNMNEADLQEANVEIRLAIFEILGVEGPFHLMFRNSFWLLGFCALYLFFTAMVPYMIGSLLSKLVVAYVGRYEAFLVPSSVRSMYALIVQHSADTVPLQFLDFFYIFGGCCGIFSAVFLLDCLAQALLLLKLPNAVKTVLELVGKLATVVKVGCLLLVRIFILPLCLGTAVMVVAAHVLLPYTAVQWARFIALHCLGAFAVAWVTGITFMLTMTISVLQLREVLHPAILAKVIRPQEPHAELINSLMQEGGFVHVRRIFVSLCVYLLLMLLLLYLPMLEYTFLRNAFFSSPSSDIATAAVDSVNVINLTTTTSAAADSTVTVGPSHFFEFVFWYVIPEIQIPLELMMSHLTFLSLLDKHKDVIGRCQHAVLVWLCAKLGLTRFVLPCPQLTVRRQASASFAVPVDPPTDGNNNYNDNNRAAVGAAAQAESDEEFVVLRVGPPLRRPPAGWDIRTPNQSTRWAWATEEPSALERSVAPRLTPTHWWLRCAALVVICFLLLHLAALFFLVVPLALGRGLSALVYVPKGIRHDPLHFVVGCMVCVSVVNGVLARLPKWETVKETVAGVRGLPMGLIYHGVSMFTHLAATHVLLALLISSLSSTSLPLQFIRAAFKSSITADASETIDVAVATTVDGVAFPFADLPALKAFLTSQLTAWPSHLQMLCVAIIVGNVCRMILCSQTVITCLEGVAEQHPHSMLAALYQWVITLKLVPVEIRLALNIDDDVTLRNEVLTQKLRNVTHHVLRPLIAEICLQCLLIAVVIAVALHWVDINYFPTLGYTWQSEFQMGVLFYVARRACVLSYYPLCSAAAALHKQVLNDNYLIGRTLVNNHPQQNPGANAAPTVA